MNSGGAEIVPANEVEEIDNGKIEIGNQYTGP